MEYDIESILEKYEDYTPGPRPMNQGPRPMFNERTQFDRGGVAKVKEYVQSLPKNTVVTRKLIKDFIDANDVNVNFDNLFAKNRPAYVVILQKTNQSQLILVIRLVQRDIKKQKL